MKKTLSNRPGSSPVTLKSSIGLANVSYYPEAMYCSPFQLSIARFSTSTAGLFEILSARGDRILVGLAGSQACQISQESAGQPIAWHRLKVRRTIIMVLIMVYLPITREYSPTCLALRKLPKKLAQYLKKPFLKKLAYFTAFESAKSECDQRLFNS